MKKKLLNRLSSMKGFTMIELLVVIAVIGVLAVAVLSAINPIEQINKGKDTRSRSDAAELLGSIERYYSTQELYPWEMASDDGTTWAAGTKDAAIIYGMADNEFGWLDNLASSQEVKNQFSQRIISAYSTVATNPQFVAMKDADAPGMPAAPVSICFLPSSQQFKIEATRKCCASEAAGGICANAGSIVNTAPDAMTVGAVTFDPCGDRAGDKDAINYICLP